MAALLAATLGFGALAAIVCLLGALVTVAPFVFSVELAERRRFSTARWGTVAGLGIGVALLLDLLLIGAGAPAVVLALPAALTWAVPAALRVVPERAPVGGRPGRHE